MNIMLSVKLQHSLIVVKFWCGYWSMKVNAGSTEATCFARRLKAHEDKLHLSEHLKIM
jgi:hypothetical protein